VEKLRVTFSHADRSQLDNLQAISCVGALAQALRERFDCVMSPFADRADPTNQEFLSRCEANLPNAGWQTPAAFTAERDRVERHS